jgi:hypothetical protein
VWGRPEIRVSAQEHGRLPAPGATAALPVSDRFDKLGLVAERDDGWLSELLDEPGVREKLDELANDPDAVASRIAVCDSIAAALSRLGQLLWVSGYVIGPDRVEGTSPWGFGDDRVVGVGVVAQIGGELASGAAALLKDGNRYGSAALTRQLLEVEYLAHAFAEDHEAARDWLRADRNERRSFWAPGALRKRAGDTFLPSDYWDHCDVGGHPSRSSTKLLPDHQGLAAEGLWVDLAVHLVSLWRTTLRAAERAHGNPAPTEWDDGGQVDAAIKRWRQVDAYAAAMHDLVRIRRDEA